jgi:hypothetical protein
LLNPEQKDLKLSFSRHRGVCIASLKEEIVTTPYQIMEIIAKGEKNRSISATIHNENSSRSHTIFLLTIESRTIPRDNNDEVIVLQSQLNLIDLAGSEKINYDADRQKECSFINKSLLTLGNVIEKLSRKSRLFFFIVVVIFHLEIRN